MLIVVRREMSKISVLSSPSVVVRSYGPEAIIVTFRTYADFSISCSHCRVRLTARRAVTGLNANVRVNLFGNGCLRLHCRRLQCLICYALCTHTHRPGYPNTTYGLQCLLVRTGGYLLMPSSADRIFGGREFS